MTLYTASLHNNHNDDDDQIVEYMQFIKNIKKSISSAASKLWKKYHNSTPNHRYHKLN